MDLATYLDPEIIQKLQVGGYLIMLPLMILEGPLVTFAAGFLASLSVFDICIVLILGWMGDIIGDGLFYAIGRFGLTMFQKEAKVSSENQSQFLRKLDGLIQKNLALSILIVKFTPYAPPIGLTYMGKLRIDVKRYFLFSIILCIPVPIVSAGVGYHLGLIGSIFHDLGSLSWWYMIGWIGVICVGITGIFLLQRMVKNRLKQEGTIDEIEKSTTVDL